MATTKTKKMVTVTIDGIDAQVSEDTLVIEAARQVGVMIPVSYTHLTLQTSDLV